MHALCIAILVILWSASESKRTFPGQLRLDLVDKQGDYNLSDTMVTKAKQARRDTKAYSAKGTGRARLKVLYQNGGNV